MFYTYFLRLYSFTGSFFNQSLLLANTNSKTFNHSHSQHLLLNNKYIPYGKCRSPL